MPLHKNSAAHAAAREPALANLTIEAAYRDRTPGSAALAAKARNLFPSGITHDGRHLEPYGVYIERGEGAHKWDVDGNRYIDYYGGHGALLLGHNHPDGQRRGPERARARHPFRRQPRARGALGRGRPGPDAERRAHPLHLVRHRGDADGGAACPQLHRPAQDPALQDAFPRLARSHDVGLPVAFRRRADRGRAAGRGRASGAGRPERRRRPARGAGRRPRDRRGDHRADRRLVRHGAAGRPRFSWRCAS